MLTQELVNKLFIYDHLSGELSWRTSGRGTNNGTDAGWESDKGYLMVWTRGRAYGVHRIAFLYYHGYLPEFIDHINGVKDDNRIKNLRGCTKSQNARNSNLSKRNTSGIKGVSWNRYAREWSTHIMHKGVSYNLGLFLDKETAGQILRIKRLELHGEFANHGQRSLNHEL